MNVNYTKTATDKNLHKKISTLSLSLSPIHFLSNGLLVNQLTLSLSYLYQHPSYLSVLSLRSQSLSHPVSLSLSFAR